MSNNPINIKSWFYFFSWNFMPEWLCVIMWILIVPFEDWDEKGNQEILNSKIEAGIFKVRQDECINYRE